MAIKVTIIVEKGNDRFSEVVRESLTQEDDIASPLVRAIATTAANFHLDRRLAGLADATWRAFPPQFPEG